MNRIRKGSAIVVGLAALSLAGYLIWANRPGSGPGTRTRVDYERRAQSFFDQQPSVRLDADDASVLSELVRRRSTSTEDWLAMPTDGGEAAGAVAAATPAALVDALRSAPDLSPPDLRRDFPGRQVDVDREPRAALARTIGEWLTIRSTGDPGLYTAWMRARGRELRLSEELEADPVLESAYEWAADQLPAEHRDRLAQFAVIYRAQFDRTDDALRPVAIAGGEGGGVEIRFGRCTGGRPAEELMSGADVRWLAGSAIGGLRHWRPPTSYPEVIRRDGEALCALVYIACQGANGRWIPTRIQVYFDPGGGGWCIDSVTIGNVSDVPWRIEF